MSEQQKAVILRCLLLLPLIMTTLIPKVKTQSMNRTQDYPSWVPQHTNFCLPGVDPPEVTGLTCATCKYTRCGEVSSFDGIDCSCDGKCLAFGDCCPDFPTECPEEFSRSQKIYDMFGEMGHSSCHDYPGDRRNPFHTESFRLVDVCGHSGEPCNFVDPSNMSLPHLAVPVFDTQTRIAFINSQCAICNGVKNIEPFPVKIQCLMTKTTRNDSKSPNEADDMNEKSINSSTKLESVLQRSECHIWYESVYIRSTCSAASHLVGQCPKSCKNAKLVQKCASSFKSTVVRIEKYDYSNWHPMVLYKNVYCAYCNNAPKAAFTCPSGDPYSDMGLVAEGAVMAPGALGYEVFSMDILFDINPHNEGLNFPDTGQDKSRKVCTENQIFVPQESACRNISCPLGFIFFKMECVPAERNLTFDMHVLFNNTEEASHGLFILNNPEIIQGYKKELKVKMAAMIPFSILLEISLSISHTTLYENLSHSFSFNVIQTINYTSYDALELDISLIDNNITSIATLGMINLLLGGGIKIGSFTILVDGLSLFDNRVMENCTWVIYKNENATFINSTLRLQNIPLIFEQEKYIVLNEEDILVCVDNYKHNDQTSEGGNLKSIAGLVTIICMSLSILCLLIRIIAQFFVSYFQTHAGHLQVQLCIALCLGFAFFLAGGVTTQVQSACIVLSMLTYVFFLAAFFWMAVLATDAYLTFRPAAAFVQNRLWSKKFWIYSLLCWICPLVLLGISIMVDSIQGIPDAYQPHFGKGLCWFNRPKASYILFLGPVACLLLLSSVFFVLTLIFLHRTLKDAKKAKVNIKEEDHKIGIYVRLAILMGISWITGFVAGALRNDVVWLIFGILNGLQGVFIFISFVCRKQVLDSLKKSYFKKKERTSSTATTSASSSIEPDSDKSRTKRRSSSEFLDFYVMNKGFEANEQSIEDFVNTVMRTDSLKLAYKKAYIKSNKNEKNIQNDSASFIYEGSPMAFEGDDHGHDITTVTTVTEVARKQTSPRGDLDQVLQIIDKDDVHNQTVSSYSESLTKF